MLSRFHLIPERYGRTDRQMDRFAISISRDKNEMTVSIINRQNQITYAANYINFSRTKKPAMLEKDSTKLRSNVIVQWAMTNHMLFRLYYITGAQSIFPLPYHPLH